MKIEKLEQEYVSVEAQNKNDFSESCHSLKHYVGRATAQPVIHLRSQSSE